MVKKPAPVLSGDVYLANGAAAKAGLNRSIHVACWSLLERRLTDKAHLSGVQVLLVNPAYASQCCSACGHTSPNNRESQAVFRCVQCGHRAHTDINAANNILARGLSPAPSLGHREYARFSPSVVAPLAAAGTSTGRVV